MPEVSRQALISESLYNAIYPHLRELKEPCSRYEGPWCGFQALNPKP